MFNKPSYIIKQGSYDNTSQIRSSKKKIKAIRYKGEKQSLSKQCISILKYIFL